MAYYGYTAQPKDYGFVAQAGRQVQQGIQDIKQEMDKDTLEKAKQVDEQKFNNEIYPAQINAAVEKAKAAGLDDTSAHIMAVKYFPNLTTASPLEKIKMFHENDALFQREVQDRATQTLGTKAQGTPAVPEQPGAQLEGSQVQAPANRPEAINTQPATMRPIASPEAARTARLAGTTQPTSMLSEGTLPAAPATGQMPPTPAQPAQPADPNDLRSFAESTGISGNKDAESIINRAYNTQFNLPEGSRAQAMAKQLQTQGGWTPEQKATLETVPTDKDLMTNKRLEESSQLRVKASKAHDDVEKAKLGLAGKKLDQQTKAYVFAKQAEAKKDMLDAQLKVKALEGALTRANKDITGGIDKGEYDTQMKELQDQYEAAATYQETISGYQDILDGKLSNTLPGGPNVAPKQPGAAATPGKPKFRVVNVQ